LIIKESEIEFGNGLNILTGETGAGKSIIIDALTLILGGRADYSLIRKDKEKLVIEGHFNFKDSRKVRGFMQAKELDENGGYIIIRRELLRKGISRTFINDTPVSVADLKAFGDIIIDIHSQNEHQSLLNKETHIDILDNYAGIKNIFDEYLGLYAAFKELVNKYEELITKKDTLLEKKNYVEFQLREINNVNPQENEEEEMENELNKLENVETISTGINASVSLLYEDEGNAAEKLSAAIKEIKKLAAFDSALAEIIPELESAYINIKDASATLNGYTSGLNYDPGRIEEIRERLGSLNFLKKKYNLSVNELIEKAKELEFFKGEHVYKSRGAFICEKESC
jgi:DNA repair protein RecN (Recombination protein N)